MSGRSGSQSFTLPQLLAHPAAVNVTIARDPTFGRAMTYRAVPVTTLLEGLGVDTDDYVQARAVDDFSVAIPARLMLSDRALLALEDPKRPWPLLRKGTRQYSAGPFYVVWRDGKDAVSSEYWTYRLASLVVTDSPLKRWPQLNVDAAVAADDPVRRGADRFAAVCFACHRFQGAGEGDQGPDLGRPMNPVDYLQPGVLRKLLRDPASVRSWPERKMPAFDRETLPDADLDAILAWLAYKARR